MQLLVTITILLFSIQSIAQQLTIHGRVMDLYTNQPLENAEVELIKKSPAHDTCGVEYFQRKLYSPSGISIYGFDNSIIIANKTKSDNNGYFNFNNIDTPFKIICNYTVNRSTSSFRVYHDIETYDLDSATIAKNTSKGLYVIRATCLYDSTSKLDYCPKCLKKDNIIPVLWGLRGLDLNGNIIDDNGKVIDDYYAGGCSPNWCRPSKYCKRCNLEF